MENSNLFKVNVHATGGVARVLVSSKDQLVQLEIILPMQALLPLEILRQKVLLRCSSIACFWSGLGMDIVPAVGEQETRQVTCFGCK